ncbi:hypothetical protein F5X96DRAFT_651006 [Biscogniauxia mediterranea]|nr:hypothetical protein F5X96DRAFT_651006 [Biscogniauxia mediterranea]
MEVLTRRLAPILRQLLLLLLRRLAMKTRLHSLRQALILAASRLLPFLRHPPRLLRLLSLRATLSHQHTVQTLGTPYRPVLTPRQCPLCPLARGRTLVAQTLLPAHGLGLTPTPPRMTHRLFPCRQPRGPLSRRPRPHTRELPRRGPGIAAPA